MCNFVAPKPRTIIELYAYPFIEVWLYHGLPIRVKVNVTAVATQATYHSLPCYGLYVPRSGYAENV